MKAVHGKILYLKELSKNLKNEDMRKFGIFSSPKLCVRSFSPTRIIFGALHLHTRSKFPFRVFGRTRLAHAVNHPRNLDLQMHTAPKALELKSFRCTRGRKDPSQRGAFVPNEDENANYKKSLFLH